MNPLKQIAQAWRSSRELPWFIRYWCRSAMLGGPLAIVLLTTPVLLDREPPSPTMYDVFWSSITGPAFLLVLCLLTSGAWGLALRLPRSRWLLVASPLPFYLMLAGVDRPDPMVLANPAVTSVVAYLLLFAAKPVQRYLAGVPLNGP